MRGKYAVGLCVLAVFCAVLFVQLPVMAAAQGGYLAGYENHAGMQPAQSSWWSIAAYVFSLLFAFTVVAFLAYFGSKFFGRKLNGLGAGASGAVLHATVLGPGRSIMIVRLAGSIMILGVSEHSIGLLKEISEPSEIDKIYEAIKAEESNESFKAVFENQKASLRQFSDKFPGIFRDR